MLKAEVNGPWDLRSGFAAQVRSLFSELLVSSPFLFTFITVPCIVSPSHNDLLTFHIARRRYAYYHHARPFSETITTVFRR
jgi:hypothetical protein